MTTAELQQNRIKARFLRVGANFTRSGNTLKVTKNNRVWVFNMSLSRLSQLESLLAQLGEIQS